MTLHKRMDVPIARTALSEEEIESVLGAAQMQRAEKIIEERRDLAAVYNDAFSDLNWLQTAITPHGDSHGYQSYSCLFEPGKVMEAVKTSNQEELKAVGEHRNEWIETLQKQGISTRPATHAVHMLSFYSNKYKISPEDYKFAQAANDCSISLPLFNGMTPSEQKYVIETVKNRMM